MKNLRISGAFVLAITLSTSCKKSTSSTPPNNSTGSLVRIQQGVDPNLANDTVYNITYNTAKNISVLVDSVNGNDSLVATYDANNNLTAVTDKGTSPINASFTYDANNHLTQINYVLAGSSEQFTFTYTSGVVSRKDYYSNLGSGPLQLQNYYTYTFTGGNITDVKGYTAGGSLIGDATVTYGTQANPFANLCLFNYGGRLGIDDIAPIESYFNKNIGTGVMVSGVSNTMANTFNSSQQVNKIIANDVVNGSVFTWQFYYK
jgi:YD repeat-containing protein